MAGPSDNSLKRRTGAADVQLAIRGMTCAACASRVSQALERVPGVVAADVNLMMQRASVRLAKKVSPKDLIAAVRSAGYDASDAPQSPAVVPQSGPPFWLLVCAAALTAPFVLQMLMMVLGFDWALAPWTQLGLASLVQVFVGARFYAGALRAILRASGNMDVLVALGSSAAFGSSLWFLLRGHDGHALYFEASTIILTMVFLGQWLEGRARREAMVAIRSLMALQPETARREEGGAYATVSVAALRPGDVVMVSAGERVPADGEVMSGDSELDVSVLSGESMPVPVAVGARVQAGAMNGMGALRISVTAAGAASGLGRMIATVSAAQLSKGQTGRMVDQVSAIFVPLVLAAAGFTFAALMMTGVPWELSLTHAIAVLVIACPCALGLAAPAAMVAGSGAAARAGIFLRDLDVVEASKGITLVAMDKTGTLTQGRPVIVGVEALSLGADAVLRFAAAAQSGLTHPLAVGLIEAATVRHLTLSAPDAMRAVPGQGVIAQFKDRHIAVGNAKLMSAEGADLTALAPTVAQWRAKGATVAFVALDGEAVGAVALRDELRPEAFEAVARLREAGYRVAILSGDAAETVARIGAEVNADEALGGLSPEDKARYLRERAAAGERAAFVGDGVNDAPALAEAALGVAVANAVGIAGEAAAITIVKSDLRLVPAALDIANRTRAMVRQNLFWAFIYNIVALPLAALGQLSPAIAGTAMALSSASVVANASRLSAWSPDTGLVSVWGAFIRWVVIVTVFIPVAWVLLYLVVPPPGTLLMLGRIIEGDGAHYAWTPLSDISPHLARAVIASEDQSFCDHGGFAWDEIDAALRRAERTGQPARGASTITQQTAKNAFLWPGRSYFRKAVEAYFTVLIESFWGKRRIMEVYLNIAEWGPGVFGAEAGSRYWFKKPAKDLNPREAAALAAILPNPRRYKAAQSGSYIAGRTNTITRRAGGVRVNGGASCVFAR